MSLDSLTLQKFVQQALRASLKTNSEIESFKRRFCLKNKTKMPTNSLLIKTYRELVAKGEVKPRLSFERALKLKKTRSISGVTPIAVLTKPFPCPGQCLYCPTQNGVPKSYLDDEPAVMRAITARFSAQKQVENRIKALNQIGHPTDKIELIVMGGTFSALPRDYQIEFVSGCFTACNQLTPLRCLPMFTPGVHRLRWLQKKNETAPHRIIGLTLETRPDAIDEEEVKLMRRLGATRVEMGVQSLWDDVLRKVKRGHSVQATIKATQLLKDAGFKVCYHLMPNLPGSTPERDLEMFKEVFSNPDFCPDMIKIYPCVVTFQAPLYQWYQEGKFRPYSDQELIELLIKIKQVLPEWVRVNRLGRDIPVGNIAAGTKISNIRQVVQREMKKRGLRCRCIRCREIKENSKFKTRLPDGQVKNLKLKITSYLASEGKEYFLQFVDKYDRLYALLRLRLPSPKVVFSLLKNSALIRELHTFGPAVPIEKKAEVEVQHRGLGKRLIEKAEKIAQDLGKKRIAVIAGVGVRHYYRRLGYQLKETYMVKSLST